jgi:hypothetical protein
MGSLRRYREESMKRLPPYTTMMLDALVSTLPRLPQNNRAAAVCRCVYQVYTWTHGIKAPWEVLGETPNEAEQRIKTQPVTIVDTTAEVIDESTRIHETDRSAGRRSLGMSIMQRPGTISRTNSKRMPPSNKPGRSNT